ncbi:hypothetical protein L3Q82_018128 [Scortum barcoo]|uniref:Uncharacterized protein n=1 Tax=Scortum barcoo TaxID=214431 RepID=A0ACB8VHZ3_9TELE|nr:hypothetical protein L3Q82_018128 [Scortum barcoo]
MISGKLPEDLSYLFSPEDGAKGICECLEEKEEGGDSSLSLSSGLSRLHGALLFIMLSFAASRGFCQVFAEVNRRSYPTFGSVIRAFTTSSPTCGEASDSASVVTYAQLKTMLSNRDIQLFDVRNLDEYQAGHIPAAVNIPLGNLEESLKLSPELFKLMFEVKPPEKDDTNIVFHCRSGKRSSKALDIARQLGFSRARHYEGGYSEWVEQEKEGK